MLVSVWVIIWSRSGENRILYKTLGSLQYHSYSAPRLQSTELENYRRYFHWIVVYFEKMRMVMLVGNIHIYGGPSCDTMDRAGLWGPMQPYTQNGLFYTNYKFWRKISWKLHFLAIGCVLEQNLRKEIPLRIQFYCQNIMILPIETFSKAWKWHWFDFGINFTHFYIVTSNLLPNFLMAVSHSFFNIMVSVIPQDQNVGSELPQQVKFKP